VPTPPSQDRSGYLDAASTEPLHPAARAAMVEAWDEGWADPGRLYGSARRARLLLDDARETLAGLLGCRADELSFAASGTAAAHLAVLGLALGRRRSGPHLVASAVEHSAVLHAVEHAGGGTLVGVDGYGRIDVGELGRALRPGTALACVQSANHEVGTLQPLGEVAAVCAAADVPLVVDAAQSIGHGSPPSDWSVLVASAHKWGGPPGLGVLAVRTGVRWRSTAVQDDRTAGNGPGSPGFPNLPAVLAAVAALAAVTESGPAEDERLRGLTTRLREAVPAAVPDVAVLGHPEQRLPHLVTFSCLYVHGEALLGELDRAGFAVSSGSSCTSSTLEPSHVLVAMGALSHGNIRVSLPRGVAEADVERFLTVLPEAVRRVRDGLGAGPS
jgi:cysteine desulfurase